MNNRCLRCHRACIASSVFCDRCQSSLLIRSQKPDVSYQTIPLLPLAAYPRTGEHHGMQQQHEKMEIVEDVQKDVAASTSSQHNPPASVDNDDEFDPLQWRTLSFLHRSPPPVGETAPAHRTRSSTNSVMAAATILPRVRLHHRRRLIAVVIVTSLLVLFAGSLLLATLSSHASTQGEKKQSRIQTLSGTGGKMIHATPSTTSTGHTTTGAGSTHPTTSPSSTPVTWHTTPTPTPSTTATSSGLTAAPSVLSFTATPGQGNPAAQQVTITGAPGETFNWQATITSNTTSWLSISPASGSIAPGAAAQLSVSCDMAGLQTGTYQGQITITATSSKQHNGQNSTQTITVTFHINQSCNLQITPGQLTFTASLLQSNPPAQIVTLQTSGNCAYPISWTVSANTPWLQLSTLTGTDNGAGGSITVSVDTRGKLPGTYTGQIVFTAIDNNGVTITGSNTTVTVTMNITASNLLN